MQKNKPAHARSIGSVRREPKPVHKHKVKKIRLPRLPLPL